MSLLRGGFPIYDTRGNQYMFCISNAGYLYRMDNGNSSDGTAITRTVQLSDFPLTREFYFPSKIDELAIYSKQNASADSITLTHYGDGSTTGTTVATYTQSHSGYGVKEERTSTSTTLDKAHCLHKLKLSLPADDASTGIELISLDIAYRVGEKRTEEPA